MLPTTTIQAFVASYPATSKTNHTIAILIPETTMQALGVTHDTRLVGSVKGGNLFLKRSSRQDSTKGGSCFRVAHGGGAMRVQASIHRTLMDLPAFGQTETICWKVGDDIYVQIPGRSERVPLVLKGERRAGPTGPTGSIKPLPQAAVEHTVSHDALLQAVRTVNEAFDQNHGSLILSIVPEGDGKTPVGHLRITREYN